MKAQERRENILTTLKGTKEAISASTLAKIFSVSRQVIVGDIALLRAQQCDIISTPKGYLMSSALSTHQFTARLVCQHGIEQTEEELEIILYNSFKGDKNVKKNNTNGFLYFYFSSFCNHDSYNHAC